MFRCLILEGGGWGNKNVKEPRLDDVDDMESM